MAEYAYIIDKFPLWVMILGGVTFIFWKFVLPFFKTWLESKDVMLLKDRVKELETELKTMESKYAELSVKYQRLEGIVTGFRVYLRANGFEDFPTEKIDYE